MCPKRLLFYLLTCVLIGVMVTINNCLVYYNKPDLVTPLNNGQITMKYPSKDYVSKVKSHENSNDKTSNYYLAPVKLNNVGLGNKMYAYASLVGIAHSKNMTVALSADNPLINIFWLEAETFTDRNMFKSFKRITSEKCCMYDETFLKMPRHFNYTIDNLLQSWRYFSNVESNIRRQLRFRDRVKSVAEKRINTIRQKYKSKTSGKISLIGVHVRRGDKDSELARNTGNYLASREYIERAMMYFQSNFSNCVFIVCSDTISWVEENIKTDLWMELITERNPPEIDMAILSLCDHNIMTVGTFGWWGSYLSGGVVVYYKNPYDEKNKFWSNVFKKSDHFPPHWIPLL